MRVRDGILERIELHTNRLHYGAAYLGIPVPLNTAELDRALKDTLVANELEEGELRLTLTRGAAGRGLTVAQNNPPTLIITAADMPKSPDPANAWIARTISRNEMSPLSQLKTISYLENIIARRESDAKNANEAILLNSKGFIAEATIKPICRSKRPTHDPPVEDGALPGVMRANILSQLDCIEALLNRKYSEASEGFLTNSLSIRPLVSMTAPLGNGTGR